MTPPKLSLNALRGMPPGEAAATLLLREMEGGADQDAAVLKAWLADSPLHSEAWANAQRAWAAFDHVIDPADLADLELPAELRLRPQRRVVQWGAIAAALLLAVGAGGLAVSPWSPWKAPAGDAIAAPVVYVAAPGAPSTFALPDGSRMTLSGGARLERRYSPQRRDLHLVSGRAYFEVAKNKERPFVVAAGEMTVTATGTQFDVTLAPDRVRVVLAEGHVVVRDRKRSAGTRLEPGQQLEQTRSGPPRVTRVQADQALEWRDGYVRFDNTPLSEALETLNAGSADQVTARDPTVAALRVNGRFKMAEPVRFSRSLSVILPVRLVARGPHRFELVRKGQP